MKKKVLPLVSPQLAASFERLLSKICGKTKRIGVGFFFFFKIKMIRYVARSSWKWRARTSHQRHEYWFWPRSLELERRQPAPMAARGEGGRAGAPALHTTFGVAAASASLAEMVTLPLDTAKVRLQLQSRAEADSHAVRYRGPLHAMRTMVAEEGPRSLWGGLTPGLHRQVRPLPAFFGNAATPGRPRTSLKISSRFLLRAVPLHRHQARALRAGQAELRGRPSAGGEDSAGRRDQRRRHCRRESLRCPQGPVPGPQPQRLRALHVCQGRLHGGTVQGPLQRFWGQPREVSGPRGRHRPRSPA